MRTGDCLHRVEKAIIIAPATTQTVACGIESNTRDKSDIDETIVGEGFAYGFHDVESTLHQVLGTGITTQFHALGIQDFRQEDGLALCHKTVEEPVSADFVREGVVGHDGLCLGEAGLQTGDNGL